MTAPSPTLPPISWLLAANTATHTAALDILFEPSPALHDLVLPIFHSKPSFPSYESLITHIGDLLSQLAGLGTPKSTARLHDILGSHPRLGAPKVASAQSAAEQAQLRASGDGDDGEAERLRALNAEYETRFPGLRYVVFVNGRSRPVVMEDMRRRIERGDIGAEEREAIQAMVDIALDRARKLVASG
ncbi:Oxo-4-hydroxy-4-carboxy-5-ureidoimidazoline decarboxylase [Xylariaceae sp. FL0662B]|nr:Oxo-4-hydroxy-4-carboxy-5-ureidoimidazoline decarboxylase [Xylariaceae sp. FL0662B]